MDSGRNGDEEAGSLGRAILPGASPVAQNVTTRTANGRIAACIAFDLAMVLVGAVALAAAAPLVGERKVAALLPGLGGPVPAGVGRNAFGLPCRQVADAAPIQVPPLDAI